MNDMSKISKLRNLPKNFKFFLKAILKILYFFTGSWYYKTKCPSIVIVDEISECFESQHQHQHDPALAPVKAEKIISTPLLTNIKIE
jgi:hypothetical protein